MAPPSDHESGAPDSRQEPIGDERVAVARERHVEHRPEEAGETPNGSQRERTPEQGQSEGGKGPDRERADNHDLRVHMSLSRRGSERPEYRARSRERQHDPDRARRRPEVLCPDDQRERDGAEGEVRAGDE